jgi:hypothetical protein
MAETAGPRVAGAQAGPEGAAPVRGAEECSGDEACAQATGAGLSLPLLPVYAAFTAGYRNDASIIVSYNQIAIQEWFYETHSTGATQGTSDFLPCRLVNKIQICSVAPNSTAMF